MNGIVNVHRIGKDQLRAFIDFIDPQESDANLNNIRLALVGADISYVKIPIRDGFLGLDMGVTFAKVPVPLPPISGIPILQLIEGGIASVTIRTRRFAMIRFSMVPLALLCSCTFNVNLTSQRTALENQIIGSQKQLDHDLILISSVRALDEDGQVKENDFSVSHERALQAKQNRQFNQDDILELKSNEIIGENQGASFHSCHS